MPHPPAVVSPNVSLMPVTARVNEQGHLVIGGIDTVELAERFGTPLYVLDEATIRESAQACSAGLESYPDGLPLYAGKAFLCTAMCHLMDSLGFGLDVVSEGELFTAAKAGFPPERIYMHGNNKSEQEIESGLKLGDVRIVVDSVSELNTVDKIARKLKKKATILLRVTPGVEPDTHHYIKTGQVNSKFGFPLEQIPEVCKMALALKDNVDLVGLHAHIGSQAREMEPFLEIIDIFADLVADLRDSLGYRLRVLDVGGGLGIKYVESDKGIGIYDWSRLISSAVMDAFSKRKLDLPQLLLEPGRSIVGTAGVTLYRAGHVKEMPDGTTYVAVDGGMSDNPRPMTYQAIYTPALANRMGEAPRKKPISLVGKFCESGDIIVKEAYVPARNGDLIAIFATGAYNYSMASNYNRTGKPACVLVYEGKAEIIIERESNEDLLRQDRVPERLLKRKR